MKIKYKKKKYIISNELNPGDVFKLNDEYYLETSYGSRPTAIRLLDGELVEIGFDAGVERVSAKLVVDK